MLLEVEDVTLRFAGLTALANVSLDVDQGELVGLIGPNGAGKSTFFNVVSGHYAPTEGHVRLAGNDVTGQPPWKLARAGVARTFQTPRVFRDLTVRENLLAAVDVRSPLDWLRIDRRARAHAEEWIDRVSLHDVASIRAGELSYGHLRQLEIARACVRNPSVLLLDEPAAGMNTVERGDLIDLVRQVNGMGIAVLLIEHNMPLVLGLCPRVAVLNFGKRIAVGTPTEIRTNAEVVEAYLGAEGADDDNVADLVEEVTG